MKLINWSSNGHFHGGLPRFSLYMSFSSRTEQPSCLNDLYRRISPMGDPNASIVPILEQWIEEGRAVNARDLITLTKRLRLYRRYKHALEVSNWMTERRMFQLSDGHAAIRLDLISRVHGLEEAEKYLNNIPAHLKGLSLNGALLNCYAENRCVQKAEALIHMMKKMHHVHGPLPYNVMLSLYSKTREFEKLEKLVQEMEDQNIRSDKFTLAIRLNAYACSCDIGGMEKLLAKIESDPTTSLTWNLYVTVANGYIKAGLFEKAVHALKKLEALITYKERARAYRMLLSLYGSCQRKEDVYRMWNLYKEGSFGCQNRAYICIIASLLKMEDIGGAERIFKEWECEHINFDFRVFNLLIGSYCKRGLVEKAEEMVNNVIQSGKDPTSWTWEILGAAYYEAHQIDKVIDALKKAVLASRGSWEPKHVSLVSCVNYLKEKGDDNAAVDLINIFQERGCLPKDIYEQNMSSVYIQDRNLL